MVELIIRQIAIAVGATIGAFPVAALGVTPPLPCESFVGEWQSSLGQRLEILSADPQSGALAGIYHSPFGEPDRIYPLVGWVNEPGPGEKPSDVSAVVTFAVRFSGHGSIVAWSGTCASPKGIPTLSMLWHSARTGSGVWEHVLTNYELWTPAAARTSAPKEPR